MHPRAQSPVADTIPITAIEPDTAPEPKTSDLERISKQYPDFQRYIESVIKKYQLFHPSGVKIENLSEEERMKWWGSAAVIVREFTQLRNQVSANTKKRG